MSSGVGIAGYAVRATGKRRTKPAVVASETANVIKARRVHKAAGSANRRRKANAGPGHDG